MLVLSACPAHFGFASYVSGDNLFNTLASDHEHTDRHPTTSPSKSPSRTLSTLPTYTLSTSPHQPHYPFLQAALSAHSLAPRHSLLHHHIPLGAPRRTGLFFKQSPLAHHFHSPHTSLATANTCTSNRCQQEIQTTSSSSSLHSKPSPLIAALAAEVALVGDAAEVLVAAAAHLLEVTALVSRHCCARDNHELDE